MIIGLQIGSTSGCAVYDNDRIVFAASEERYTNKKNDSGFPYNAIKKAIEICNITSDRIEQVVLVSQKMTPVHYLCDLGGWSIREYLKEQREYYLPKLFSGKETEFLDVFSDRIIDSDLLETVKKADAGERFRIWNEWRIEKVMEILSVPKEKVCILNHEYCHAAYAMYGAKCSDYQDAICFVYDGYGDDSNASVYIYEDGINQIATYTNFNIGRIYRYITLLLGMKPNEHEFKVMGLAPYATKWIYKEPLEVFRNAYKFVDGQIVVDPELKDNYLYFKERLEGMRFDGIAGALQIFTEEMTSALVEYWMKKTGKTVCFISGGCALNIKANMVIGKLPHVKELYVVGSAGDESLCIGAIFQYLDEHKKADIGKTALNNLYLGDMITSQEVREYIDSIDRNKYDIIYHPSDKMCAEKLAQGCILGRVSGKMEFGARALGNRSILADPRKRETIDKINQKIKSRDFWMPFTPSILYEEKDRFLDNPKNFKYPYMAIASETTEEGRMELQAAIHPADKTARPQLVTHDMNEGYYKLLKEFKNITGTGALLNTSLNIHGYPIARTVEDAFWVLENSDLDGIIFDEYLILRK